MKRIGFLLILFIFLLGISSQAQITLEGYVYQSDNRGFLNRVHVKLVDQDTGIEIAETLSDINGFFAFEVDLNKSYKLISNKEMFEEKTIILTTDEVSNNNKVFARIEMSRAPGYVFEITMAEKREDPDIPVDAIRGALIEVYNNTSEQVELVFNDHPHPDFQVNMLKGNHYTILIRKAGYLAKRLEAFVDVEGCILCFEGVGKVEPGISDNLTEGNEMGVLLANLELEKIEQDKTFEINNLYYDLGKWELKNQGRAELDKVINLFKDNPGLIIELGSHTDARGKKNENQELSEKRAQSAVSYLKTFGGVPTSNIVARGYGESNPLNKCVDGVDCSESQHARNRRTELKIIGEKKEVAFKTLAELKAEERMDKMIKELQDQEQVKVKEGEQLSDVLKKEDLGIGTEEKEKEHVVEKEVNESIKTERNNSANTKVEQEVIKSEAKKIEDVAEQGQGEKSGKEVMEDNQLDEAESLKSTQSAGDILHRIVIHFSYQPLPSNHTIYSDHEDVYEYISDQNYRYYLIGAYRSEADAHDALEEKWLKKYPNAYIMTFKGDKRIF